MPEESRQEPVRSRPHDARAGSERSPTEPGILEGAGSLLREMRGIAHDYMSLVALETKRAGQSLMIMMAAAVMIAILLVSAWLGLVAAGVFGMTAAGMAPGWAILVAVIANLLVAAGLYFLIRHKRQDLAFPATIRNLRPGPEGDKTAVSQGGLH